MILVMIELFVKKFLESNLVLVFLIIKLDLFVKRVLFVFVCFDMICKLVGICFLVLIFIKFFNISFLVEIDCFLLF